MDIPAEPDLFSGLMCCHHFPAGESEGLQVPEGGLHPRVRAPSPLTGPKLQPELFLEAAGPSGNEAKSDPGSLGPA